MKKSIRPFPLLIKSVLIFLVVNLVYAWIDPSPSSISLVNHILPGFSRFPVIRTLVSRPDGSVGAKRRLITDLDILFGAHEIAGTPKSTDEYRVVFLGDSSMWGSGLDNENTLVAFINQAKIETCDGKKIRAYSLGYPTNSATKDLLILLRSDNYAPDMFVWTFSLQAFLPDRQNVLVDDNLADFRTLLLSYNLNSIYQPKKKFVAPTLWDQMLWNRRQNLRLQLHIQGFALSRNIFGTDDIRSSIADEEDMVMKQASASKNYMNYKKTANLIKGDWLLPFDTIRVAYQLAGERPLLLINEPIYITTGVNKAIRYNWIYPRWAFDQYRDFMSQQSAKNRWNYSDQWNLLSQEEFIDAVFHRTSQGNQHLANVLIPLILENSCK